MDFAVDIHDPQRLSANVFGDPLTFAVLPLVLH